MGTRPWGWHEHVWERCSPLPILPSVGEHDDLNLSMAEHDAMRDISAHWGDEVPCNASTRAVPHSARWVWWCRCGHPFLGCDDHRRSADLILATQRHYCGQCSTLIPSPIPWLPL